MESDRQIPSLSRRGFLAAGGAAAGSLVLGFHLPSRAAAGGSTPINAWLSISGSGEITILCPSAEMGQGVFSTLPAVVAEELHVRWESVLVEFAPVAPAFANPVIHLQATFESTSVRGHFQPLRIAGASAREMLVQAGADRWKVPAGECEAVDGAVVHQPTGRKLPYGALAADAARLEPPKTPQLTPMDKWRLLRTRLPRKDTPAKVNGNAVFGMDVALDSLLTGVVLACPVIGGRLRHVDDAAALAIPGVGKVVRLDEAVIVVGDHYWAALKGVRALKPEWDTMGKEALDDELLTARLSEALLRPGVATSEAEEIEAAWGDDNGTIVTADYHVPYLAHATMEPMNATAHVRGDRIDIWAPTQSPQLARFAVAGRMRTAPENISIHTTFLGGGFGRRSEADFILYAVEASRAVNAPVKVVWTREEDMSHDFYRPCAAARLKARLDDRGRISLWSARLACQSIMARIVPDAVRGGIDDTSLEGAINLPYAMAKRRTEYALIEQGLPVGFWRSPGHNQNAFFTESFIDELANAAQADRVAFRLSLLEDKPRHRAVLERAAAMIGWDSPRAGRHYGIALHESHGSIVAEGIEIEWVADKKFRIERISCVIDCGVALNPDTIEAQMESGIVYALSAALFGEINVKDGRVAQANFHDYPVLRLKQMPRIDIAIIEGGEPIGGVGEPSTPPLAPALTSAIFVATGERIRSLPLTRHGLELV